MEYLIDVILLGVILLSTFIGYKKGLIKVAFGLISFLLAIVISILIYRPISNFIIEHTSIDDQLEETIENRIDASDDAKEETHNIITNYYSDIKNASSKVIAQNISETIVNIGCMLLVFIITKIILFFFKFSGDLIAKLPLIKQCNSVGGFLYGLLKGFIIIYIFFAIVTLISPIIDVYAFTNMINSSIIANIMYNNNIIFILFT